MHPPLAFFPCNFFMIPIAKIASGYLLLGMGDTFWHMWHHLDAVTWRSVWIGTWLDRVLPLGKTSVREARSAPIFYSRVHFRRAPRLSARTYLIHALYCTGRWRHHIPRGRLSSVCIRYAIVLRAVGIGDRQKSHRGWRMHSCCETMIFGERPAPQRR